MDTHVFDLTVVDVVEETADAHSVSFAVPEGAEDEFDYKPGPVPDPRGAERPDRRGGAAATRCPRRRTTAAR